MKLKQELLKLQQEYYRCNVAAYSAQAAFFLILSFFPFLMCMMSVLKYTPLSMEYLLFLIDYFAPNYLVDFLSTIAIESYQNSFAIAGIYLIIGLWSAGKGIQCISAGLNQSSHIRETRNWIRVRLLSSLYTILMIGVLGFMLVVIIFGRMLHRAMFAYYPAFASLMELFLHLRWFITFFIMVLTFDIMYTVLPNRRLADVEPITWLYQLPGAVYSAIGCYIFSFIISIFVDIFGGFSMYGSMATLALVMFWLYFCMYIIMFCAILNDFYSTRMIDFFIRKLKERRAARSASEDAPTKHTAQ